MKNRLRIRFILYPVLVTLSVFAIIGGLTQWQLGKLLSDWHHERATTLALVLAESLRAMPSALSPTELREFAKRQSENINARMTVVADDGLVLADSSIEATELAGLENHANRPEIIDAKRRGIGVANRFSKTLGKVMLYVATPYRLAGQNGVVRVAVSTDDLDKVISVERIYFLAILIAGLIVAAGLGAIAAKIMTRMIKQEQSVLEQRVEERTEDVMRLQNLGTLLSACNNVGEATDVVKTLIPNLLTDVRGALALYRASRNILETAASWGGEWQGNSTYSPDECWALRAGRSHPSTVHENKIICGHLDGVESESTLCIPMTAHGQTLGVLHLAKPGGHLSPEERHIAAAIAEQISLAVANIQLRQSLRDQAIRDPLTNLYNRRFLMETMEIEIHRAQRNKHSIAALMIDVDNFKRFNDTHGHDVGDLVLSKLGQVLHDAVREHDIACRFGGEEFTIVMPEVTAEVAANAAERICDIVRKMDVRHENKNVGPFSISIGVALYPSGGETVDKLLKAADTALYRAKNEGRDRFVLASAMAPAPKTKRDSI